MTKYEFEQFREFYEMAEQASAAQSEDAFVQFIRFCVERLNKGDQVQAIWRDYQDSVQ